MIIVRVELHSAITGEVTELGRMDICNVGGTIQRGDYTAQVMRGRSREDLSKRLVIRGTNIENYPRQRLHVWHLVSKALSKMGYGK